MKPIKLLYLAVGVALLVLVFREVDLRALWDQVTEIGLAGIAVVLVLYLGAFVADTAGWQLALSGVPLTAEWLHRLFLVRMVGEALNTVTPLAGMGGEPVKAVLLKTHYGVGYRASGASLLLAKTTNMLALVVFLAGGFTLILGDFRVPPAYQGIAGLGLAALTAGTILFFLVQRLRFTSFAGHRLSRWRYARRIEDVLHHIRDFDQRLVDFYSAQRGRFAGALALAFLNWFLGVLELYYAMAFLGVPVSFTDAWIIEAFTQLVRAGTFFIPASLGAQEGAFMLVCGALTGNPLAGLAAALVRRFRELVWTVAGLVLGWAYSLKPAPEESAAQEMAGR